MDSQEISFRVIKEDFAPSINWVASNLPSGSKARAVLRAVVIDAGPEGLELSGFDYEVSSRVRVAAEVAEEGRLAVNAKLLADITGSLPNKPIDMQASDSTLIVECGSSHFELPLIPLEDYPPLPDLPEVTGTLDALLFRDAVEQVAAAAGADDTFPMLTGVHIEIEGDRIQMAATDRFRLAQRFLQWEPQTEVTADLLVPAKTLKANARSLANNNDPIEIAVGGGEVKGEGLFGLHAGRRKTTTRMLGAEFPSIKRLVPQQHSSLAVVNVNDFKTAIARVKLMLSPNGQIRLEFSEGQVRLAAGDEAGHASEMLPCSYLGGADLTIAFNPSYLTAGLSVVGTDNAVLCFGEPSRPVVIIPEPEGELPHAQPDDGMYPTPETDFIYMLMPVRLPG